MSQRVPISLFGEIVERNACLLLPSIPIILGILNYFNLVTTSTFKLGIFICFLLFVVLPVIYKFSYTLQRSAVFLTFVHVSPFADYKNPQKYGLKGSRNFYITTDDYVKLGVWQVLPENLIDANTTGDNFFENILSNGQNVVIYSHGNGGTRLSSHRIEIYQILRKYFHVIAFDYRNYGDSTKGVLNELGVVNDLLSVYRWIQNRTNSNIFLWGHSLGTSISSHAVVKIQEMGIAMPIGLILEAPFNNMKDEISEFPLAKLFKYLPWFDKTIVEPMSDNFHFATDKYICKINVPIMILHAEDDKVVPYKLGYKLFEVSKTCRRDNQGGTMFYSFSEKHRFGHRYICRAVDLPERMRNFINHSLEVKEKSKLH